MSPVSFVRRVAGSIAFRTLPRYRAIRAAERENLAFDEVFGTKTSGEIPLSKLSVGADEAARGNGVYRATPQSLFGQAMEHVDVEPESFTFVDYGSGAGKVLLLAAARGFRDVVGVEFSKDLHDAACANIVAQRYDADRAPRAIHGDASTFVPPETPLVCFFFNPFCADVWRSVLTRLSASWEDNPRPIHLAYVNIRNTSELGGILDEFPRFRPRVRDRHVLVSSACPVRRAPQTAT